MQEVGSLIGAIVVAMALVCPILAIIYYLKFRKSSKEASTLSAEVEGLRKYQGIKDAETEAARIKQEAETNSEQIEAQARDLLEQSQQTLDSAIDQANQIKIGAQTEADKTRQKAELEVKVTLSEARKDAKSIREKAQKNLDEATRQAFKIVDSAKTRAEEIAGDALKAKGKADQYEKAARAMKNVVDGYGDEYVVPASSILDELAEDFGHKEAGVALKKARQLTKTMIQNGLAADCDYVEKNRRTFAIQFVLDAFNGKVDTILAKVRHDNFGKLEQAIKDAFNLVNHNGAAFRDARIRKQYLAARLDELKWAVATHRLQLEEREEQRQIREAMREEERARREYAKAQREAEKEEKMLQKAMEKARQQLMGASEEQRQEFENKIAELEQKLVEAEEKNQRALSMAQQTKRGHVYVISNTGSFGENVYKIGLTRRLEPLDRVKELGDASVPFPFDIHAMIFSENAPALENELHKTFNKVRLNKVNLRKEFFRCGLAEIRKTVEANFSEVVHWTMKAEAQEYHESLAMEAARNRKDDGSQQVA